MLLHIKLSILYFVPSSPQGDPKGYSIKNVRVMETPPPCKFDPLPPLSFRRPPRPLFFFCTESAHALFFFKDKPTLFFKDPPFCTFVPIKHTSDNAKKRGGSSAPSFFPSADHPQNPSFFQGGASPPPTWNSPNAGHTPQYTNTVVPQRLRLNKPCQISSLFLIMLSRVSISIELIFITHIKHRIEFAPFCRYV